jgi:phosphoribosylformylglycinamidine synthase
VPNSIKAIIPLLPGTNGELEAARGFEAAGAAVDICIVRSLTPEMIEDSYRRMAEGLGQSQILLIPGGSVSDSGIDYAKIAAVFFRNDQVAEALVKFLERGGLVLGLGGGFLALCAMGLLPGAFAPNPNGTHLSRFVQTRVVSVESPWMALCVPGEVYTLPVSAENVYVPPSDITPATVYTDGNIEGIYSENGRILGKMGHHERLGPGLCKNIPQGETMRLFEAGVRWFM